MSCGGCGCCPKCGCRATCTCNRSIFSLDSQAEFSFAMANENDGQEKTTPTNRTSCCPVAGENGGGCVNCGWRAPGGRA